MGRTPMPHESASGRPTTRLSNRRAALHRRSAALLTAVCCILLLTGCSQGWTSGRGGLTYPPVATAPSASTIPHPTRPSSRALHSGADDFDGRVTAYTSTSSSPSGPCEDVGCVQVDGVDVVLQWISPFGDACVDRSDVDDDAPAARDLHLVLPLGSRVHVHRDAHSTSRDGVVHRAADWDPARPAVGSVNELLVRRGWWGPSDWGFLIVPPDHASSDAVFPAYRLRIDEEALTATERTLVKRLKKAVASALRHDTGGQALCAHQWRADARDYRVMMRHLDRENERIERWLRKHPEYTTCRDGDGDGRCESR